MTLSQTQIASLQQMGITVWQDKNSASASRQNTQDQPAVEPPRPKTVTAAQGLANLRAALGESPLSTEATKPEALTTSQPVGTPLIEKKNDSTVFNDVFLALESVIGKEVEQTRWIDSSDVSATKAQLSFTLPLTAEHKQRLWAAMSQL